MTAFALRAERYTALHSDPRVSGRTGFFAAAAVVTRAIGALGHSQFLAELSGWLETVNTRRATAIRCGLLYEQGTIESNTDDFIRYEQSLVQIQLDRFKQRDPNGYRRQVVTINRTLQCAGRLPIRLLAGDAFLHALVVIDRDERMLVDFADQSFRECLGRNIATGVA